MESGIPYNGLIRTVIERLVIKMGLGPGYDIPFRCLSSFEDFALLNISFSMSYATAL